MGAIRTFAAIEIPNPVQQTAADIQNQFRSLGLKAAWVRPENIHLTLKFLGEIDPSRVGGVIAALTRAAAGFPPLPVALKDVGCFPKKGPPRVLWVGMSDPGGALAALHGKIERTLGALGFSPEKKAFSPHLTLARIKTPEGANLLRDRVRSMEPLNGAGFYLDAVTFFESQLTPRGSIYTVLERIPLTAKTPVKEDLEMGGEDHGRE
ncbi:MAG: RNA 2',3'-cyclic phosphodiesterase [Nitrospinaceae bacterium]